MSTEPVIHPASKPTPAPANPGLSAAEAASRLAADGPNSLPGGQSRTLLTIALETLREPMFMLLLAAAGLYLAFGELQEGLTLTGFVVVTLVLTLFQEGRTERAIDALRDLTSPQALVLRDGQPQRVPSAEVVCGDVLLLHEGDRIAADAWLLPVAAGAADGGLQVDESLLTGEAVPVRKTAGQGSGQGEAAAAPSQPGGDDLPWVYAGTLVVQGQAQARVCATGARSQIGRIGSALGELPTERSPLQTQTDRLVRNLAWLALGLSLLLILVHGLLRGDWIQALLAGIALAMALLPEEYPVVLAVYPALGAWRLSRQGVLTRRITAIETLGATTVLCTDKTGTLTENRMRVAELRAGGVALDARLTLGGNGDAQAGAKPDPAAGAGAGAGAALPEAFHSLLEFAILASAQQPFDPMEQAFARLGETGLGHGPEGSAGATAGSGGDTPSPHLHRDWQLVQAYPLSPELRALSQVWAAPGGSAQRVVASKGAPEAIVALCHLSPEQAQRVAQQVDEMAAQGLRVLAVARAGFELAGSAGSTGPAGATSSAASAALPPQAHDYDFEFLGLLGLADPLRAEVPAAVQECRQAGIRVVMITGDYPATARAIAAQAGLTGANDAGSLEPQALLSGDELDGLDDAALRERMAQVRVCARIAPAQKLRIVQALKARGEVVAMTGDGVNDAPALRAAHVGMAMGKRGTDVAREAASLVLVDDHFGAIVNAMRMGRRIFDNLRKAMSYVLAVHVPIAGMALLPVLLGWPPLLTPMHIALLELIIDPACALAFEHEPAEPGLMQRPPRNAQAPLFPPAALGACLLQGAGVLGLVLLSYTQTIPTLGEAPARAAAFITLVVANLALILSNRGGPGEPLLQTLRRPNPTLWAVVASAALLLALSVSIPWAQTLLHFAPLPGTALLSATALGLASLAWYGVVKVGLARWTTRAQKTPPPSPPR